MGRPSTIDKLPSEIRELIGRLRENGRTIDEIRDKLGELDVAVSRSALGRHVKQLSEIGEQLRRSRAVAEAMVVQLGDAPEGRAARLNVELLHSLLLKLMVSEEGSVAQLDAREAMFLASAIQKLTAADKADADRTIQLRKALKDDVGKSLDAIEKNAGGSDPKELLRRVREEIYGIIA